MSTPHIGAEPGDFAKTVLMSGDPLRAKFVAENYLTDVKCVNEIRGMLGYTGKYEGKEVSMMGHGMGIPSICIYTYELYNFFDVDNIIRIGTAGALQDNIRARDFGTLAAEMETSGLYMNAADAGKNALSILSVSDHLFRKDNITPEERQTTLTDMIEIALQTAVEL